MTCRRCSYEFCWGCLGAWRGGFDEHYSFRCSRENRQDLDLRFGNNQNDLLSRNQLIYAGGLVALYGIDVINSFNNKQKDNSAKNLSFKEKLSVKFNQFVDKTKIMVKDLSEKPLIKPFANQKALSQISISLASYLLLNKLGVNFSDSIQDGVCRKFGARNYFKISDAITNIPFSYYLNRNFENGKLINLAIGSSLGFVSGEILDRFLFNKKTDIAENINLDILEEEN